MLTLHLRPSDPITIRHAGEEMTIILDERKPDGRTRLVFDAPLSFEIVRLRAEQKRKESKHADG